MPRINDQFLDSVFYLYPNRSAAERGERAGGTGFWASYVSDIAANTIVIFAVSNKHVVADSGASVIRVNNRDGGIHTFELEPHEWHFTNKDDIAIVNISVDLAKQRIITIPLSIFVTKEVMKDHDLGPGDEVFMVGRFISHDGHLTNIPSVRFGNMSISEASLDHPLIGTQDSFAVEMRSMAGYSGSPVFIYPSQWNMNTGTLAVGSGSLFLLGINWGYVVDNVEVEERNVSSLAALVVVSEAWANSQPVFVFILCGLAAVVLTLAATRLALATLEKISTITKSEPVRSKKRSSSQARNRQVKNNTAIILGTSIIISTIIAVGGAWVIFNWPTQLQYDQTRLVFTTIPLPPLPDIHQSLGYHVLFNNSGPLEIRNYRLQYKFKSTKEPLTIKETDDEFDDVSHHMPDKDLFSNSLPAGGGGSYITLSDDKYTLDDWREVLGGRLLIYMFVTFKYEVGGKTKYSDICLFFNKNYPAVHNCYRNNKTYYDK